MTAVYDSGVLIGFDRQERAILAMHHNLLKRGHKPVVTAPVVAQVRRSPRQVQLNRLLRGCELVGFEPNEAAAVGALLASSGTSDVVDAHVVVTAQRCGCSVVTGDVQDIAQLIDALDDRSPAVRAIPLPS